MQHAISNAFLTRLAVGGALGHLFGVILACAAVAVLARGVLFDLAAMTVTS